MAWNLSQHLIISGLVIDNQVVRAIIDTDGENTQKHDITHAVYSNDTNYNLNGATFVPSNKVRAAIFDKAGVYVSSSYMEVREGGLTANYTLSLRSQPRQDVTIDIQGSNADIQLLPTTIVFTREEWNETKSIQLR